VARAIDALRERVIPDREETVVNSALEINEDEDLLTPSSQRSWLLLFTRPIIAMASALAVITLLWSRNRFGEISGGALAMAPDNAQDLFKLYIASWHDIGMWKRTIYACLGTNCWSSFADHLWKCRPPSSRSSSYWHHLHFSSLRTDT